MNSIFISHSHKDGGAALKLSVKLKEKGIPVWLDMWEINTGADWNRQVAEAIRSAGGFVILVGADPNASQRFEWREITELDYYLDPTKPIVPVILGSAELPGFLRTRQVIQVAEASIDFDSLAARIADALGKPEETIDQVNLERGREARENALRSLRKYTQELEEDDLKRAGLRGLK